MGSVCTQQWHEPFSKYNLVPGQWQTHMEASEQTTTPGSWTAWHNSGQMSPELMFNTQGQWVKDETISTGDPSSECSQNDVSFSAFSRWARPFSKPSRERPQHTSKAPHTSLPLVLEEWPPLYRQGQQGLHTDGELGAIPTFQPTSHGCPNTHSCRVSWHRRAGNSWEGKGSEELGM